MEKTNPTGMSNHQLVVSGMTPYRKKSRTFPAKEVPTRILSRSVTAYPKPQYTLHTTQSNGEINRNANSIGSVIPVKIEVKATLLLRLLIESIGNCGSTKNTCNVSPGYEAPSSHRSETFGHLSEEYW